MYKCKECGCSFEEPEIISDSVPYGNGYVNTPAETICPYCGGDIEETEKCQICGCECLPDEIYENKCVYCLQDEVCTIDNIFEYSQSTNDINDFVCFIFDNKIENINEACKELLKFIYECAPEKMEKLMDKYVQENFQDISDWWYKEKCQD